MTQQEQIWQDVMELANRPGTFTHGLGLHVTGIGDGWAEGELTAGDDGSCGGNGGLQPWQYLPDGELRPAVSGPGPAGTAALPGGECPHGAADRGDAGLGGGRSGRPLRRGLLHLPLQARRTQGLIPPRPIKATLRRWRWVAFVLRLSGKSGKEEVPPVTWPEGSFQLLRSLVSA